MLYSDYAKTFEFYSGKLSDLVRTLAFSGIAVIWIFKANTGLPRVPHDLFYPLGFLVVCLACDLLQYLSGTISWGYYVYYKAKPSDESEGDPDLYPSHWWELPINLFFVLKLVTIVLAYASLIGFIWKSWLQC